MISSWLASLPSNIPVTFPEHITMILSDIPNNSGISEDIIIILFPRLAKSAIMVYISYLAPTSIPLVGSSRISMSGSVSNQRENITFC